MVDNEGLSKQHTQKLISEHKVKMIGRVIQLQTDSGISGSFCLTNVPSLTSDFQGQRGN